jgi:hypothetical protein
MTLFHFVLLTKRQTHKADGSGLGNGRMKIFVTGTRGIPDIPEGVEKHCQELYPRIAARGHEVILSTRSSYAGKIVAE